MTESTSSETTERCRDVSGRRGIIRRVTAPILTLLVILPVLTRHINKGEFNYNVDETQHAFTGVFFADLIRDHPIHNPVEYTYLYYAHYPALSGIIHWPPFFYFCEGVVFLLLGPSVVAARLAILSFAVVGLWFWFRLIEELHSTVAAVVATVVLALCRSMLLFEKTVMLEIPSIAMCIIASYFWICFLRKGRNPSLLWFALTGALAMLTKQNAIYLLLFCFLSISALGKWQLLWRRATLAALALGACLVGPYYYVLYKLHWIAIAGDVFQEQTAGLQRLTYYWRAVPQLVSWYLLVLALVGLLTCLWWNRAENNLVFLSWVFSVYLTLTLIGHKESRYAIYLVPGVVYFSIWPILLPKMRRDWLRIPCLAALVGVMAYTAWSAWRFERPYVIGYAPVAHQIRQITDSGIILVDADIPANLIFYVRLEDSARRFVVLRKSLYAFRIKEALASKEYIHTREELWGLVNDDGIRFIVVSDRPPAKFPVEVALREMLQAPPFHLVGRYAVEGNSPEWKDYYLSLYENASAGPPVVPSLRIPMLTIDHDIEVQFQKLGITPALSSAAR
jgi:hypothetical protein